MNFSHLWLCYVGRRRNIPANFLVFFLNVECLSIGALTAPAARCAAISRCESGNLKGL